MSDRSALTAHRLSGMERIWLVADRLHPPFVNQMVIEGEGIPQPPRPWPVIASLLAEAQPASRARLRGRLFTSRWVADGPLASVCELHAPGWDGQGPEGAPLLKAPLDPRHGPTCAFVIARGDPSRVIVRTHHALMDGQGTKLLAEGFFAILRGEQAPTADLSSETDASIARRLGIRPERIPRPDAASPVGDADGQEMETTWARRRVEGAVSKLLPRLLLALGRVEPVPARPLRVAVPVDLRRYLPGLSSSANLTGLLRLTVQDHLMAPDPVESISAALQAGLDRGDAAAVALASRFARLLPLSLMASFAQRDARRALSQGRYGSTAVISNLGVLPTEAFSGAGFAAKRAFFVPPGNPGLPLFLAASGDAQGVELCACMPAALASRGRLASLLDELAKGLTPSELPEAPPPSPILPPP